MQYKEKCKLGPDCQTLVPPPRQKQEIQPQAEGKELADLLAAIVAELIAAMEEMGVVLVLG